MVSFTIDGTALKLALPGKPKTSLIALFLFAYLRSLDTCGVGTLGLFIGRDSLKAARKCVTWRIAFQRIIFKTWNYCSVNLAQYFSFLSVT